MRTLHTSIFLLVIGFSVATNADEKVESENSVQRANADLEETGKLYFTGTGYTVNLIPHAIIVGLLTFAIIFLYGDSLFGSDDGYSSYGAPEASYGAPAASYGAPAASYDAPAPSYGAPAPAYGAPSYAANRYYDPYAADAASALGTNLYPAELNPYNPQETVQAAAST